MLVGHAKHGFPVVPKLDLKLHNEVPTNASSVERKPSKKKSLFAEQFENKDLAFFGITPPPPLSTVGPVPDPSTTSLVSERDCVEPIFICQVTGRKSLDRRPEDALLARGSSNDMECSSSQVLKDTYSSTAAVTWDKQVVYPVECVAEIFPSQSQVEVQLYLWGRTRRV